MADTNYATLDDMTVLFRALTAEEQTKATNLLAIVSAELRTYAKSVGKDLDAMIATDPDLGQIAKSVTVDVVGRTLNQDTSGKPVSQETQSALGYSWTGTYLNPGGGVAILKNDLKRLGLRRQRMGVIDPYDYWDQSNSGQ